MGETGCMIHPEAKLLSSCEPVKPEESCASKLQWQDIHIPKGRNWEEETKPSKVEFQWIVRLKNNPL